MAGDLEDYAVLYILWVYINLDEAEGIIRHTIWLHQENEVTKILAICVKSCIETPLNFDQKSKFM